MLANIYLKNWGIADVNCGIVEWLPTLMRSYSQANIYYEGRFRWRFASGLLQSKRGYLLVDYERSQMPENHEVREMLESRISDLHQEVEQIVSSYWDAVLKMEKERKGGQFKNKLRLRCIKQRNSVRAEWQGVVWTGKGKDGKYFDKKEHITKPAGSFTYTLSKLYKFAHEWEKEIVNETEAMLAGIRQEAHHLTRALISIGHAENAEVKRKASAGGIK